MRHFCGRGRLLFRQWRCGLQGRWVRPRRPGDDSYGFSHYILLRESLFEATHGKLDLFRDPKIRNIALFGPRISIINGTVPPFEDCHTGTTVDPHILWYCSHALGLGLKEYEALSFAGPGRLVDSCFNTFPNSATESKPTALSLPEGVGVRSYFDKAQVLVCRPFPGGQFGAAIKGGDNNKPHNHNDVGSFVIVMGKVEMSGDPGGPFAYNSRTFGPGRYTEFKTFGSYGHPVPLVAGVQQKFGAQYSAKIVKQDFTESRDIFAMDMKAAYPLAGLEELMRTFVLAGRAPGAWP